MNDLDLSLLWSPFGLLLVGLCVGSFLNVLVHRLPTLVARRWWFDTAAHLDSGEGLPALLNQQPEPVGLQARRQALAQQLQGHLEALPALGLSRPGSHCPACARPLRWHENIPVLGWFLVKGRCASCGAAVRLRYPLVEAATGLIFVGMGLRWGFEPTALLWGGWAAALLAASLIDWETTLLPDSLTLPLLWTGLAAALMGWTLSPSAALWGALLGYSGLWLVVTVFEYATGQHAMGGGDLKLLAALGAWLGPAALLPVIFLASVGGAAVGMWMKSQGALREGRFVPFGPFLAGAGFMVAVLGVERFMGWVGL